VEEAGKEMRTAGRDKRIVIIGAGISGLSAGCYARMNGYEAQILEAHNQPGGLCTSWKRKGYLIDGSCHWVTGSGPGNEFYPVWQELGALEGRRIVDYEYYTSFTGADGRVFRLYTDVDRLERHMKELSPADAAPTEEFCGLVRTFAGFGAPVGKPAELMGLLDGLRMMRRFGPYMKLFKQLGSLNVTEFASRFKDPLIRDGILGAMYGVSESLFPLIMSLGPMSRKAAGYPIGGSLEFARGIERRFTSLGGRVSYGARVTKVLEENGRAIGVRLADGSEVPADYVVSACDLKASLTSLLDGKRMDPVHRELLSSGKLIDPMVQVSFGVDMDLSGGPPAMSDSIKLSEPINLGGRRLEWLSYKNYAFDPTTAPPGKTVLISMFLSDWEYWEKFEADPSAYAAEKKRTADHCARALESRYPGLGSRIEMTDVATPLTYARYTGNWKGVYMTWLLSPEFQRRHRYVPKTVPGLDAFYIASMWTSPPGGLPGAASAGRGVVQLLCARDRKRFITTKPSAAAGSAVAGHAEPTVSRSL
jgi:phytoene dehydrogenase-like protein